MILLWIIYAGNPPKIVGDDLSTSGSSGSQHKDSTKKKPGSGPSKSKSPTQQPSVTQVEGKKGKKGKKVTGSVKTKLTSLSQVQPSSGAQLRAPLNTKKTTGSVTTSPLESAPLTQPPSVAQIRAPKGEKMAGSAIIGPISVPQLQQPLGVQVKRKRTALTQLPASEGEKVTGSTASSSESTSIAQQ
jgi:hypothetical protein